MPPLLLFLLLFLSLSCLLSLFLLLHPAPKLLEPLSNKRTGPSCILASLASGGATVTAAQLTTGALSVRLTLHCTGVTVTGEGDCLECRGAD